MSLLPLLPCIAAFLLLGLSTDAHHRRRFGHSPDAARRKAMRGAAWGLLAVASLAAVAMLGWVFGPILWVGATMGGAATAFLALNLIPAGDADANSGVSRRR